MKNIESDILNGLQTKGRPGRIRGMNTIFFHRVDPVTKGEGEGGGGEGEEQEARQALRPYPKWRPREFHEWVYPKRAETMAEFGTKATENAHAIRACKRVHVLSPCFFSNMDPLVLSNILSDFFFSFE